MDVNQLSREGETPLYTGGENAEPDAVRVLAQAGADPLLTGIDPLGQAVLPLKTTAYRGRKGVVRKLVQQLGVEACGGPSRGLAALRFAGQEGHKGIPAILTDGGVVDTGRALVDAAGYSGEASVRFLLQQDQQQDQQQEEQRQRRQQRRQQRPLDFLQVYVRQNKEDGPSEEALNILEAFRRLLLGVEAVHAVSWLWYTNSSDSLAISQAAEGTGVRQSVDRPPC
eukprot:g10553.t1